MTGKKGCSGRRPRVITSLREEAGKNPARALELLEKLYTWGLAGDKDCAIYYCDRMLGKPKQQIDMDARMTLEPSPDQYAIAARLIAQSQCLLGPVVTVPDIEQSTLPHPDTGSLGSPLDTEGEYAI